MTGSRFTLRQAAGRLACLGAVLGAAGCGEAVSREEVAARRAEGGAGTAGVTRAQAPAGDTSAFVVRLTGVPMEQASAVMQLQVTGRDFRIAVADARGLRAQAGLADEERVEAIPGSRVSSEWIAEPGVPDSLASAMVGVRVPVLTGERYLLQVEPLTTPAEMAMVTLSSDGMAVASMPVPLRDSADAAALFEVAITSRGVEVGPEIELVEIVPTCGTTHLVRSGGRANLYAQYSVLETGETGEVHLPPRAADARFRSVSFRTRTRGAIRITYLGFELARAEMPAGCPAS